MIWKIIPNNVKYPEHHTSGSRATTVLHSRLFSESLPPNYFHINSIGINDCRINQPTTNHQCVGLETGGQYAEHFPNQMPRTCDQLCSWSMWGSYRDHTNWKALKTSQYVVCQTPLLKMLRICQNLVHLYREWCQLCSHWWHHSCRNSGDKVGIITTINFTTIFYKRTFWKYRHDDRWYQNAPAGPITVSCAADGGRLGVPLRVRPLIATRYPILGPANTMTSLLGPMKAASPWRNPSVRGRGLTIMGQLGSKYSRMRRRRICPGSAGELLYCDTYIRVITENCYFNHKCERDVILVRNHMSVFCTGTLVHWKHRIVITPTL